MKINFKKTAIITLAGLMALTPVTAMASEPVQEEVQATETQAAEAKEVDLDSVRDKISELYTEIGELYDLVYELSELIPEAESTVDTEAVDALYDQINAAYEEMEALEEANALLWVKLYENETMIIGEAYDEKAYIEASTVLTDEEKASLLELIEKEAEYYKNIDELYAQIDALWGCESEKSEYDEMYDKASACYSRENAIKSVHADIWDKIEFMIYRTDAAFGENFDEIEFINNMTMITEEEKAIAIVDYNAIRIFEEQANNIYNTINEAFNAVG